MELGKKIRQLRIKAGLTQELLAYLYWHRSNAEARKASRYATMPPRRIMKRPSTFMSAPSPKTPNAPDTGTRSWASRTSTRSWATMKTPPKPTAGSWICWNRSGASRRKPIPPSPPQSGSKPACWRKHDPTKKQAWPRRSRLFCANQEEQRVNRKKRTYLNHVG